MHAGQSGFTAQRDHAVAYRRGAADLMHHRFDRLVSAITVRRQAKSSAAQNVVAMEILNRCVGFNLKCRWNAAQRCTYLDFPAPALVVSRYQLAELSELRAVPLQAELQWRLAQASGAPPRAVHSQQAGIAHTHIGAQR